MSFEFVFLAVEHPEVNARAIVVITIPSILHVEWSGNVRIDKTVTAFV